MEPQTLIPAESAAVTRRFVPTQSCGGLVAAVGLLFLTGVGVITTLPGCPLASTYPTWTVWVLRLAPLPIVLLLWAVVSEADFRVKTDASAICFRHGLGRVTRVPWREVHDYFADCGRALAEVAEAGGSLTAGIQDSGFRIQETEGTRPEDGQGETAEATAGIQETEGTRQEDGQGDTAEAAEGQGNGEGGTAEVTGPPFAQYRPDHVLFSARGIFTLTDVVAHLSVLTDEVVKNTPPTAPPRWEEASWVVCPACRQRFAASLWPWTEEAEALEPAACPACGQSLEALLEGATQPFVVEVRGARRRSAWRPSAPIEAPAEPPAPIAPAPVVDFGPTPPEGTPEDAG